MYSPPLAGSSHWSSEWKQDLHMQLLLYTANHTSNWSPNGNTTVAKIVLDKRITNNYRNNLIERRLVVEIVGFWKRGNVYSVSAIWKKVFFVESGTHGMEIFFRNQGVIYSRNRLTNPSFVAWCSASHSDCALITAFSPSHILHIISPQSVPQRSGTSYLECESDTHRVHAKVIP